MSEYRIAIAGVGVAADTHARAYAQVPNATVVACAGPTAERVRSFADDHDCDPYADVGSMLDAADPDVLSVCTPSADHLDPALAAADRGIDVLCEKPLEITTERVDRMIDAAADAGIRLGGIFQRRYEPVMGALREAVAAGRFGSLAVANAAVPWWRDDDYYDGQWQAETDAAGGGAIITQSIHAVDAIQWIVGAGMDLEPGENPVEEVAAYTDVLAHDESVTEVEDSAVASLRYRDGTVGQILGATSMYPGGAMRYELGGRDGTVRVRGGKVETWEFREEREADAEIRATPSGPAGGSDTPDPLETANVREFLDARQSGESFMLDGRESRKAVAIVEAIYESAETGEPVAPP